MRKVGLWLRHGYAPTTGGGFSYFDALLRSLASRRFDDFEICLVSPAQSSPVIDGLECIHLGLLPNKVPLLGQLSSKHRWAKVFLTVNSRLRKKQWRRKLENANVSLLYYATQSDYIMNGFPFVTTVWDMGYYVTYPFPELIQGNNFKGRRRLFTRILPKALMVFCESEAGKKDLIQYANINECKIRVVPIFAGNVINMKVGDKMQNMILEKYGLARNRYFFYPAQFWAHKNHVGILKAFKAFVQTHADYKVVFTGGDKGNKDYVKNYCRITGLIDHVLFLGFVENEEIYTFYKNATALVMASFFGPTNMPPIEAMHLGCPVICSDIDGHREIMGEAAFYFEATNNLELVAAMNEMSTHHDSYRELLKQQLQQTKFTTNFAIQKIEEFLNEALMIRNTWK